MRKSEEKREEGGQIAFFTFKSSYCFFFVLFSLGYSGFVEHFDTLEEKENSWKFRISGKVVVDDPDDSYDSTAVS